MLLIIEVRGLADSAVQDKLNQALKELCLEPFNSAEEDSTYNITPIFHVIGGNMLSIVTYNNYYVEGAAYPVSFLRSQLYDLITGDTVELWDLIKDKEAFKQLLLDGRFAFTAAGIEEEIPELTAEANDKLLEIIDTAEFGSQFFFGDGGRLIVWSEGSNHATGDYWLFDIPVIELDNLATERFLPIVEEMKAYSN